jgi:triacylglycerol lipase
VHGTFGDMTVSWNLISPKLKQDGYCVFALDYGNRATGPIEDSAAQLRDFVARVLAATGARKVSLVGHSQGGMMPRYYINFLGGASKVAAPARPTRRSDPAACRSSLSGQWTATVLASAR